MAAETLFGPLAIRADASPVAGIGHLMRGLALAQSWQDRGGRVRFVTAGPPPAVAARLEREGFQQSVIASATGSQADAGATLAEAVAMGSRALVVDGYGFGADYLASLKGAGRTLLFVDDLAAFRPDGADLVLNQNLQATAEAYAGIDPDRLMLGSRYALLRREFVAARGVRKSVASAVPRLLLTMGGSDPANVSERLLQFLGRWQGPAIRLTIVTGPANPHRDSVRTAVARLGGSIDAELVADPPDLPSRLAAADLAISAAGTSCWELACLGVPMLLVVVADNQRAGAETLRAQGIAEVAGWHAALEQERFLGLLRRLLSSREDLRRFSAAGRALIDGQGAGRVVERLATYPVALRAAQMADAEALFKWANDPLTRRMSFHTEKIAWADHLKWLEQRLSNPDCRFRFATETGAGAIGQARLDREGEIATLSIGLAPTARGRGLAARLIRRAAVESLQAGWCARVDAWVRPENAASLAAFRRAGFQERESQAAEKTGAIPADALRFSFP